MTSILSFVAIISCVAMAYGSAPYYALNYFDEMAQSMCTSVTDRPSFVFAVRRNCAGGTGAAPTCDDICRTAKPAMSERINHQRTKFDCFDAYRVGKTPTILTPNPTRLQPDAGKPFMTAYRYFKGGCTWKADHCGPNYCCCRMYN